MTTLDKAIDDFIGRLSFYGSSKVVLGLSGGVDSVVLLRLLASRLPPSDLTAVYVDHQLQPEAKQWGQFCKTLCDGLNIRLIEKVVLVETNNRQGVESNARHARYEALLSVCVAENACLVTAHHQQDQAETLLLNLGRGTGLVGLVGMPEVKTRRYVEGTSIHQIDHFRPLKHCAKSQIQQFASTQALNWVDDPSNDQQVFKRNWVRQTLLPCYQTGWPQVIQSLDQLSLHVAEAQGLLNELAEMDLESTDFCTFYLTIPPLLSLSRQKNLFQYWLQQTLQLSLNKPLIHWFESLLQQASFQSVPSLKQANFTLYFYDHKVFCFFDLMTEYSLKKKAFDAYRMQFVHSDLLHTWLDALPDETRLQPVSQHPPRELKRLKKWFKRHKVPVWDRQRWPVTQQGGVISDL